MSTNPFRRSSFKDGAGSGAPAPISIPADPPGSNHTATAPLSKHVNFASPPDIISPASYPPSPESSRQEFPHPLISPAFPNPSSNTSSSPYGSALASDPFFTDHSEVDDDSAIDHALRDARVNAGISPPATPWPVVRGDAVRDTLGRFASAPRRVENEQAQTGPARSAMDVNAFTKLLLTGQRETPAPQERTTGESPSVGTIHPASESSSSADTASTTQRSLFETAQPSVEEESPRSSYEADSRDAIQPRPVAAPTEIRKKPPPPKSRRGKPLRESTGEQDLKQNFNKFMDSLSISEPKAVGLDASALKFPKDEADHFGEKSSTTEGSEVPSRKTPPAPPLARRKSQQTPGKPLLTRSTSSRYSVISDYDVPPSPSASTTNFKAPPPPPARRTTSSNEGRPSFEVRPVPEDEQVDAGTVDGNLSVREARPGVSQTPSYLKRLSQGPPPPIPPPRRGRGSSRSSVETQRPSMATLGFSEGDGGYYDRDERDENSTDILADLAALQREVDAARATAN
ncbi:hypothetical protein B0A52_00621 [Exophiala mesophila]|uniref:Uncharacterized protein n=1 Tax=Exophiala mesophila TaxID=212818 RepID=A0A438NHR5_EXOME|nr:hypothetical protein B0A52_00621 [Exophiala mesophila]